MSHARRLSNLYRKKGRLQACMIDEQNTGSCLCQKTPWPVFVLSLDKITGPATGRDDRIEKNDS